MLNEMLKTMFNPPDVSGGKSRAEFLRDSGKKIRLVLGFILFTLLTMSTSLMAQTATPPEIGDGSSGNPYQIATLNNLYWLSQNSMIWDLDLYYIQTADIDALTTSGWDGGSGFSTIGNTNYGFFGSYDGQNHTIDGLNINRSSTDYIGLFGRLQTSTIQDLGVTNVNITGYMFVGGLVGFL